MDFGHLKYRLLNLKASSSIIVIDFDKILEECIAFNKKSATSESAEAVLTDPIDHDYVFEICYKLLNELKTLSELNNQVLVSLCEYLLSKYDKYLTKQQTDQLRTIQLTAEIFQFLSKELKNSFEIYKRHHSDPLLIIEQLLMNSHIDLCSRAIQMCRDTMAHDTNLHDKINKILVKYARKALEFKMYKNSADNDVMNMFDSNSVDSRNSPQTVNTILAKKKSNIKSFLPGIGNEL